MAIRKRKRRRIVAEDLLRLHVPSSPRISPDGSRIVYVERTVGEHNDYTLRLRVVEVETGVDVDFTGGEKDRSPRWSPDGSRIAFIRKTDEAHSQVFTINAAGGEASPLTCFPEGSFGDLRWSPDGRHLAVAFREQDPAWTEAARNERRDQGLSDPPRVIDDPWYRLDGDGYFNAQRYTLYVIDSGTGEHRCLYNKDTLGAFSFDFAPSGRELVVATNRDRRAIARPEKDELLRVELSTGKLKPIPGLPPGPKNCVRWSPDGSVIAYVGREGEDFIYSVENAELFVCDPRRGNARSLTAKGDQCLMAIAVADTADALFSPTIEFSHDGARIYYKLGHHGGTQIAAVPTTRGAAEILTAGEHDLDLGSISADGKRMAVTVASVTRPPEVALATLDWRTRSAELERLTERNEPLRSELDLARAKSHWAKTSDGHRVHFWELRPPHLSASRRTPAVLQIHGGPHAQYGYGFFHEMQLLAAQGYTVFYGNPRGSKGYGRDHCAAIRGQWGTADWTDMQAIIESMKGQKNVDSRRLGVMGGSYGGYMTNWIIGHTHDFKAAVTDRCVSNLVSMFGSSDYLGMPDKYFPGNAWDRPEALWEQSPLRHFGKVKTPTLIIHSEGDLRCNIEQAEQVFNALQARRIPSRFVRYPASSSHGMSRMGPPDLRLHRLEQILGWWKKYLG